MVSQWQWRCFLHWVSTLHHSFHLQSSAPVLKMLEIQLLKRCRVSDGSVLHQQARRRLWASPFWEVRLSCIEVLFLFWALFHLQFGLDQLCEARLRRQLQHNVEKLERSEQARTELENRLALYQDVLSHRDQMINNVEVYSPSTYQKIDARFAKILPSLKISQIRVIFWRMYFRYVPTYPPKFMKRHPKPI